MKFSIKDFFSKYGTADLVTLTEEILSGKLHFLSSVVTTSGGYKDCATRGRKCLRGLCLKIFINQIILQLVFRQNYNPSKLCSLPSNEFFTLISCTGKSHVFFVLEMYLKCFGF